MWLPAVSFELGREAGVFGAGSSACGVGRGVVLAQPHTQHHSLGGCGDDSAPISAQLRQYPNSLNTYTFSAIPLFLQPV
jgi:hypothetical protein